MEGKRKSFQFCCSCPIYRVHQNSFYFSIYPKRRFSERPKPTKLYQKKLNQVGLLRASTLPTVNQELSSRVNFFCDAVNSQGLTYTSKIYCFSRSKESKTVQPVANMHLYTKIYWNKRWGTFVCKNGSKFSDINDLSVSHQWNLLTLAIVLIQTLLLIKIKKPTSLSEIPMLAHKL